MVGFCVWNRQEDFTEDKGNGNKEEECKATFNNCRVISFCSSGKSQQRRLGGTKLLSTAKLSFQDPAIQSPAPVCCGNWRLTERKGTGIWRPVILYFRSKQMKYGKWWAHVGKESCTQETEVKRIMTGEMNADNKEYLDAIKTAVLPIKGPGVHAHAHNYNVIAFTPPSVRTIDTSFLLVIQWILEKHMSYIHPLMNDRALKVASFTGKQSLLQQQTNITQYCSSPWWMSEYLSWERTNSHNLWLLTTDFPPTDVYVVNYLRL